jgi:phage tail sheath protein FI
VYVEEVERGSKSVEGVSTSTAGFLGEAERGPVEPRLVTSYTQFERLYGTSPASSDLDVAVDGFFRNGGGRCYVARVTAEDPEHAATATVTDDEGTALLDCRAVGPGEWGESVAVIVADGQHDTFDLVVRYWSEGPEAVTEPAATDPDPVPDVEEIHEGLSVDPSSSQFYEKQLEGSALIEVEHRAEGRPAPGLTWLDRESTTARADGGAVAGAEEPTVYVPSDLDDRGEDALASIADPLGIDPGTEDLAAELAAVREGEREVSVEVVTEPPAEEDEELTRGDYEGVDRPGLRTGLAGFKEHDEISIVCAPDENRITGLTEALVTHCENMGERFAVLQAPQNPGVVSELHPPVDSSYAAYYYPWIEVADPETDRKRLAPPGGHVAGLFARSDAEYGVHKAPANEVLRGVLGVQHDLTKGEQDVLNPRGVNCIRQFQGRGIRLWGARTTASDPEWKYVNVRRLFLYIEQSIDEGTQWAVFEPNDADLWARVRQSVENFLTTLWREGGLQGQTAEEAFYVRCGEETMTQDDIDNGRLIVEIGVAPVKPAEFVVFRISQDTGDS